MHETSGLASTQVRCSHCLTCLTGCIFNLIAISEADIVGSVARRHAHKTSGLASSQFHLRCSLSLACITCTILYLVVSCKVHMMTISMILDILYKTSGLPSTQVGL